MIIISARLTGTRDTSGLVVLDTGVGAIALDQNLAVRLGVVTRAQSGGIGLADRPLPRVEIGRLQVDQVSPVLTIDGEIVRRVTDRPVLALIGGRVFQGRGIVIDYRDTTLEIRAVPRVGVPKDAATGIADSRKAFADVLTSKAVGVPFRLAGDDKIVVRGRVSNPDPPKLSDSLNFIIDTGATKCVMFEEALAASVPGATRWQSMRGLSAPTLIGNAGARMVRIPRLELLGGTAPLRTEGVDAAVIESELAGALSRSIGETANGLLGYSFLGRHHVIVDYANRVLWLDPSRGERGRPYEYSHIGIQIEREGAVARIVAVADRSPAADAGIRAGDEVVSVDGASAKSTDVITLAHRLEGPPSTRVIVTVRRGSVERTHSLVRRKLL